MPRQWDSRLAAKADLDPETTVIRKPCEGIAGRGVEKQRLGDVPPAFDECDDILSEHVEQHPYAASINPHAANTIRVVTLLDKSRAADPDDPTVMIASATHRFGSAATAPTDNWSSGGFAAPVALETGRWGDSIDTVGTGD